MTWAKQQTASGTQCMTHVRMLTARLPADLRALPLSDLRPAPLRRWVLSRRASGDAPLTTHTLVGRLRTALGDAVLDEVIAHMPLHLRRGDLPPARPRDPDFEARTSPTVDEIRALTSDPHIRWDRRWIYTGLSQTGARLGEIADVRKADVLRWSPLSAICLDSQWNSKQKRVTRTKTGATKYAPVRPRFAGAIARVVLHDWSAFWRRPIVDQDILFALRGHRNIPRPATASAMSRWLGIDCALLGIPRRTVHGFRRAFLSEAISHRADKAMITLITHARPGDSASRYIRAQWPAICAAALHLPYDAPGDGDQFGLGL